MACEAYAVPSRAESSAIDNTQRRSGGTRKEHHNPQADALQYSLDNFMIVYTQSPNLRRRFYNSARISKKLWSKWINVLNLTTKTVYLVTRLSEIPLQTVTSCCRITVTLIPSICGYLWKLKPLLGKVQFLARLAGIPSHWTWNGYCCSWSHWSWQIQPLPLMEAAMKQSKKPSLLPINQKQKLLLNIRNFTNLVWTYRWPCGVKLQN